MKTTNTKKFLQFAANFAVMVRCENKKIVLLQLLSWKIIFRRIVQLTFKFKSEEDLLTPRLKLTDCWSSRYEKHTAVSILFTRISGAEQF